MVGSKARMAATFRETRAVLWEHWGDGGCRAILPVPSVKTQKRIQTSVRTTPMIALPNVA